MSDENNKNSTIDRMAETYSSSASDAKAFQEAQTKTIVNQSKQINVLVKLKDQLEDQIKKITGELVTLKALTGSVNPENGLSDEETVCITQIALLKNISDNAELTLEEAKKFELYTKSLREIRAKAPKKEEVQTGRLSNDDLLAALRLPDGDSKQ